MKSISTRRRENKQAQPIEIAVRQPELIVPIVEEIKKRKRNAKIK